MPTVVDRLIGTLKLGDTSTGVSMEAQVTQVGTPQTVTRDAAVTVLTGDIIQSSATYSNALTGQVLLDLSDPDGIFYFVVANQGQQVPFTLCPIGATDEADLHRDVHRRRLGFRGHQQRVERTKQVHLADTGENDDRPARRRLMADDGLTVRATNGPAFDAAITAISRDVEDLQGPLAAAARELAAKPPPLAAARSGRLAGSHRVIACRASKGAGYG